MAPPRKRTDWLHLGSGKSYAHRVHRPLQCLVFITPLLLFYQIASTMHPWSPEPGSAPPQHVVAFILMLKFFGFFGAAGNVLPLAAVVAILLFWHLARKDPWDFDPRLYLGMAGESVLWGIPFFVIALAVSRHGMTNAFAADGGWGGWGGWGSGLLAAVAGAGGGTGSGGGGGGWVGVPWQTEVVLSIGAGIYEELLFRLIAITSMSIILVDVFELKLQVAVPIIIVVSAALFSAYHYLGNEPFDRSIFFFRAALGVYLAGIYIYRGFGIVVGAHAVYDLFVVAFTHMHR